MHRKSRVFVSVVIWISLVLISACSGATSGIAGIFSPATATPTLTATSTSTATATATATLTPTPIAPLMIKPCPSNEDCADITEITTFVEDEVSHTVPNQVTIYYKDPVRVELSFTARDQETLDQNMEHVRFFLEIDGINYFNEEMLEAGFARDANGELTDVPGYFMGAAFYGWLPNEGHQIRYGYVVDEKIDNGFRILVPQTYETSFIVAPAMEQTPTPTPEPTVTPTYVPVVVYPTPSCNVNSYILIDNETGLQITMFLTGPSKFMFLLDPGVNFLPVCEGIYSITAYGCAAAQLNDAIKSGDAIVFYCN